MPKKDLRLLKEKDYWGRKVYFDKKTKKIYKDVEGILHTTTKEGEPLSPIRKGKHIHSWSYFQVSPTKAMRSCDICGLIDTTQSKKKRRKR